MFLVRAARLYFTHFPIERGKWRLWKAIEHRLIARPPQPRIIRMVNGARIYVDPTDSLDRFVYFWGQWELNESWLLRRLLRVGDTFVDVGANIGYFTLLASRLVGAAGAVTAIEATPPTAEKLRHNIVLNALSNVAVHVCAIGEKDGGTIRIYRHQARNSGMNSIRPPIGAKEGWDVPCFRLDVILPAQSIRLIKMDIEGAELFAVRGMLARLRDGNTPDLMIEIWPPYLTALGCDQCEILKLLQAAGYHAFEVGDRILRPASDNEFLTTKGMTAYFTRDPDRVRDIVRA
jgi:FkbM family methyltransferase